MARNQKNYKKGNKFNKRSKIINKKEKQNDFDKKRKNFKFIKRSKESEDAQRRQKIVEDKYRKQNLRKSLSEDEEDFQDNNPFEQLLSTFKDDKIEKSKNKAIESSSDEENITEDDESLNKLDSNDEEMVNEEEENTEVEENDVSSNNDSDDDNNRSDDSSGADSLSIANKDQYSHKMSESDEESEENEEFESEDDEEIQSEDDEQIQSEDDEEIESEYEENISDKNMKVSNKTDQDPFSAHLDHELSQSHIENLLKKPPAIKKLKEKWPELGDLNIEISDSCATKPNKNFNKSKISTKKKLLEDEEVFAKEGSCPELTTTSNLDMNKLQIKNQLISSIEVIKDNDLALTPFQLELFSVFNNYQDLFYSQRNFNNAEQIRFIYCVHALNHMLKTRSRILHHNAKLSNSKSKSLMPDSYKDQGLIRPKILIILPFRDSALRTVNFLISLMFGNLAENAKKDGSVINYKRFIEEFTGDTIKFPKTNPKPDDYEKLFCGNTDDTFRIGISLTKKCLKLYQDFYSSDILIASPLGLRMIVGAPGDKEREYDFLNSIELLILDQAELFLAQNWDHLLHVLDHLHLQPQSVRNTDFSRVRSWCLNGLSRFYRQTLLFTSHELPEFRAIFNNKCYNYRGKIKVINSIDIGSIRNVVTQVPQVFHKIDISSIQTSFDTRFKYFINEILPQYKSPSMAHCMIYIPSYFDFVRLRNYFKTESLSFVQICEYTEDGKMARARDMFFHSGAHFLLYSERAHFFRRTRIKGIRHLIMYQPPCWPHFYAEMINLMQDGYQNSRDGLEASMSVTILYSKYDMLQVSSIIGTERAAKMLQSNKMTHMFTKGD